MMAATAPQAFLIMWVTFSVLALAGLTAVLVWAVRSRQFVDQDRKRYLALWSDIPADEVGKTGDKSKERYEHLTK